MSIEVWKKSLFRGYRKVATQLYVFAKEGNVFASWVNNPMFAGKLIPVSDELAAHVLGARRVRCPHSGTQPVYSMFGKPGYTCREKSSGEDCNTIEQCTVCGYRDHSHGNPRFRAYATGEYSWEGHPELTYLKVDQESDVITNAAWAYGDIRLTLASGDGSSLIVWVRNTLQDGDESYRSFRQQFPRTQHLYGSWDYSDFLIFKNLDTVEARR